jgi:hypothetical protein
MNTKLSGEERIDSCLSTLGEPMSKGNSMFEDFWKVWPSNPRKGAKSKCKQVWIKSYCNTQADQIIKHVQWLKTTEQWLKSNGAFIPAPLVYLNQQRWDGAEIPEIKRTETALEALEKSRKSSVPMPDDIRAKLAALRGRT